MKKIILIGVFITTEYHYTRSKLRQGTRTETYWGSHKDSLRVKSLLCIRKLKKYSLGFDGKAKMVNLSSRCSREVAN